MNRENFGSKLGAILAAAGSAVGLGNVWRFPIETGQNGGAAFIIIYIMCIITLGLPIMISEFLIGRYTHSNTAGAYRILSDGSPWKWVGRMGVFTGWFILCYYAVVGGWTMHYTFLSLTNAFAGVPATQFGQIFEDFTANPWIPSLWFILCYYAVVGGWTMHYTFLSLTNAFAGVPATQFGQIFEDFTANPWIPSLWFILFIGITHFIITRGVQSGIERFSKIMMPTLFIITLLLTFCSLSLPGAADGIEFLLKPDWSKVNSTVVLAAVGQAFYSLSLGKAVFAPTPAISTKRHRWPKLPLMWPLSTLSLLSWRGSSSFPPCSTSA